MKKSQKKKMTPSRERYEKGNPTISARIPLATRVKLLAQLETLEMSLSAILKVLAGELEVKAKPIEDADKEGFQRARRVYMVTFPCSECGKPIPVTDVKTKAAVASYLAKEGWKHSKCPNNGT